MTKEITKARVLQEMQDKLLLREFIPEKFLFSETVTPVYNIEQHLEQWWQNYIEASVTGIGIKYFYAVPEDERWHLKRYDVVFMSGAFTIAGVYIRRRNRDPSDAYMYLDLTAAQNTSYHHETDVVLTAGDTLNINVDGYTSTGDLRLYIDYKMEKIR